MRYFLIVILGFLTGNTSFAVDFNNLSDQKVGIDKALLSNECENAIDQEIQSEMSEFSNTRIILDPGTGGGGTGGVD